MGTATTILTIDPEFKSLLVPLTTEEKALLAESLRREGCRDPLTVWAGENVVLDGHARLKLCRELGIPFSLRQIDLPDRQAAREWVWQNQTGRRNLRPSAAAYTRGVLYRSIKKRPGARTDLSSWPHARKWASQDVAKFFGVDESTVRRDARFARDLDLIAGELGEEFKLEVLTGKARLSRQMIRILVRMYRSENGRVKALAHLRKLEQQREEARAARRNKKTPPAPAVEPPVVEAHDCEDDTSAPAVGPTAEEVTPAVETPPARTATASPAMLMVPNAAGYDPASDAMQHADETPDTAAGNIVTDPVEESVDENLLGQLSDLFRSADQATRFAFLGQPLVRATVRRLDALSV